MTSIINFISSIEKISFFLGITSFIFYFFSLIFETFNPKLNNKEFEVNIPKSTISSLEKKFRLKPKKFLKFAIIFILLGISCRITYPNPEVVICHSNLPENTLISVNPIEIIDRKIPSFYYRYNPSLIKFINSSNKNNTIYISAIRESTTQLCEEPKYDTNYYKQRPINSRIILGFGDNPYRLKYLGNMTIIDLSNNQKYPGLEDPRIFKYAKDKKIGVITGHEFQLYLSKLSIFERKGQYEIKEESRVKLIPNFVPDYQPQKNWVRFPAEFEDSKPWFIYDYNKMIIVEVDFQTGVAKRVFYQRNKNCCINFFMKGSTNLIPFPTDKSLFFGITHQTENDLNINGLPLYKSYFVGIRYDGNQNPRLESLSDYFIIPKKVTDKSEEKSTSRINFPMSIGCYDKECQKIFVTTGNMDCTAHVAIFNTSSVMKMLKKIKC